MIVCVCVWLGRYEDVPELSSAALQVVQGCVQRLAQRADAVEVKELVLVVLMAVVKYPTNKKLRTLRLENPKVKRLLVDSGALPLLFTAGFSRQSRPRPASSTSIRCVAQMSKKIDRRCAL